MAWSNQQPMPSSVRRMRLWAWLLGYAVVLLLAVVLVSALLAGYARQVPGSASVEPAYAAQGEVFDAALELALTPGVGFTGSFSSDAGDRVLLDAEVSNEGSMLATLTVGGQDVEYLATGDRRFVRAGGQVWAALGESAADAALYAGQWAQVDPDFLGVDLASVLAPQRLAWVIADPAGLAQTDAPGAVEQVNGVAARPIRAGELTVWVSQGQPQRIVRIRAETPAGQSGDLTGGGQMSPDDAGDLVPDPDDPVPTGDPGEDPGAGPDPGAPPVEDPTADAGRAEELDILDFEADLAAESVEQVQELLEQAMPDKVRELTESIDSRVSFSLDGEIVLAPCGPNGCTATVSLTNSVTSTSPYVTVNQPVNAEVTTTMTLDGAPVATCSAVLSMPPNGSASTQCSASYYIAPSQNPRTYTVAAEAIAIARALFQADINAMLTDLAEEQTQVEFLGPDARPIVPGERMRGGQLVHGLQAHEGPQESLGHTIVEHVGRTDADLLGRLVATANDPRPVPAVSTWSSLGMADRTVGGMIADHQADIEDWLADPAAGPTLTLHYTGPTPITGRYVARGSTTVSEVTGAVAVLQRSSRGPGAQLGYIVRTSYPEPA